VLHGNLPSPTFLNFFHGSGSSTQPQQQHHPVQHPLPPPPLGTLPHHHHPRPHAHPGMPPPSASSAAVAAAAAPRPPHPHLPTPPQNPAHIAQARAALVGSIGNLLDGELASRAALLHGNAAALARQERNVARATEALRRENDRLAKVVREGSRRVLETGNVQNWAEVLERDFLVLEDTMRRVRRGERRRRCRPRRTDGEEEAEAEAAGPAGDGGEVRQGQGQNGAEGDDGYSSEGCSCSCSSCDSRSRSPSASPSWSGGSDEGEDEEAAGGDGNNVDAAVAAADAEVMAAAIEDEAMMMMDESSGAIRELTAAATAVAAASAIVARDGSSKTVEDVIIPPATTGDLEQRTGSEAMDVDQVDDSILEARGKDLEPDHIAAQNKGDEPSDSTGGVFAKVDSAIAARISEAMATLIDDIGEDEEVTVLNTNTNTTTTTTPPIFTPVPSTSTLAVVPTPGSSEHQLGLESFGLEDEEVSSGDVLMMEQGKEGIDGDEKQTASKGGAQEDLYQFSPSLVSPVVAGFSNMDLDENANVETDTNMEEDVEHGPNEPQLVVPDVEPPVALAKEDIEALAAIGLVPEGAEAKVGISNKMEVDEQGEGVESHPQENIPNQQTETETITEGQASN
jgi:hypothetical protein